MAYITSKLVKKEDIPMENILNNDEGNILNVNEQYCIGGLCTKISMEIFVMKNKKAKIIKKLVKSDENDNIKAVIDRCSAKAIGYIE